MPGGGGQRRALAHAGLVPDQLGGGAQRGAALHELGRRAVATAIVHQHDLETAHGPQSLHHLGHELADVAGLVFGRDQHGDQGGGAGRRRKARRRAGS